MAKRRVLIVDDERLVRWSLDRALKESGYATQTVGTGEETLKAVERDEPDVILLDIRLPDIDGLEVLRRLKDEGVGSAVIMLTGQSDVDTAVQAVKLGATDFIPKPFNIEDVRMRISRALEDAMLRQEVAEYRRKVVGPHGVENMVGESTAMQRIYETARKVAESEVTTALILGESGTGKDLIARSIHALSSRSGKPFMQINCSAVPETLLESELFGHERGAFTDAHRRKKGLLEVADGGTVFLDEIGDMPLSLQAKILGVLENKRFRRVGSTSEIAIDVRTIAATNRNLQEKVDEGTFREDLYYRLKVIPIELPPLRDRKEDIPALVDFFITQFNSEFKRSIEGIKPEALELLKKYSWPGNVRELKNVVERATLLENSDYILPDHLPAEISNYPAQPTDLAGAIKSFPEDGLDLEEVEKSLIVAALERAKGNKSKAARLLSISRDTLRYRLEKFDLE